MSAAVKLHVKPIGDKIGWSREKVKDHAHVLDSIGATNLNIAKAVQNGRAPTNGAIAPLDFTEGWFREITKLNSDNQKNIIKMFIESKGKQLKDIYAERARLRQAELARGTHLKEVHNQVPPTLAEPERKNVSEDTTKAESNETRDKVAEDVGMKRTTYTKTEEIVDKADSGDSVVILKK